MAAAKEVVVPMGRRGDRPNGLPTELPPTANDRLFQGLEMADLA